MLGWYHDGLGWGGWLAMALGMVVFWGLVVLAVMAIFRGTREEPHVHCNGHKDPLAILDERFARGEIDETEYRARADVLRAAVH